MAELEEFKAQAEIEEQNKEIVQRFFEEVWKQGKLNVIDEIFATDYTGYLDGKLDIIGSDGLKQFVKTIRIGLPDIKPIIEDQIAEGDKVLTRWITTATHKGELFGIPATGIQVTWTGMSLYRMADGKIVERWKNADMHGLMQQLGMELKPKKKK